MLLQAYGETFLKWIQSKLSKVGVSWKMVFKKSNNFIGLLQNDRRTNKKDFTRSEYGFYMLKKKCSLNRSVLIESSRSVNICISAVTYCVSVILNYKKMIFKRAI